VIAMKQDLIEQLNIYRLENKLSQPKLAEMIGVTFQTVNRWLNRHMKPGQIHEYHIRKLLEEQAKRGKHK
jgi:transcriptional regulator with XRE-family HTH domain